MSVELDGFAVIEGRVAMPRHGAWTADLLVDTTTAPTGQLSLVASRGLTLVGTVRRSGIEGGLAWVRMVGGAGRLDRATTPRHYVAPLFSGPWSDVLGMAGETQAADTSTVALAASLEHWTLLADPCGRALDALAATQAGMLWRVLPDGTVWLGAETWAELDAEVRVIEDRPHEGTATLGTDEPLVLRPGFAVRGDGRRLDYVEHIIESGRYRADVWWADDAGTEAAA